MKRLLLLALVFLSMPTFANESKAPEGLTALKAVFRTHLDGTTNTEESFFRIVAFFDHKIALESFHFIKLPDHEILNTADVSVFPHQDGFSAHNLEMPGPGEYRIELKIKGQDLFVQNVRIKSGLRKNIPGIKGVHDGVIEVDASQFLEWGKFPSESGHKNMKHATFVGVKELDASFQQEDVWSAMLNHEKGTKPTTSVKIEKALEDDKHYRLILVEQLRDYQSPLFFVSHESGVEYELRKSKYTSVD